ncbi:MAG: alkaline phosphatase family protein, partial [Deltaproteobacteria bacterium]|nr:alkaline phosphatase family protein [Deltaproteobacteria bacterium]
MLTLVAAVSAWRIALLAMEFNSELALPEPAAARTPPAIRDPRTPRLSHRVVLVIVDGLRLDASYLPAFDALRARGAGLAAATHYPTWSRPGYITLLTGVPPEASGVRVNLVPRPIRLDSIMKRVTAAGMRVTTASDIGMVPPLFINEDVNQLSSLEHPKTRDLVTPTSGLTWPFDEVRKADTMQELEKSIEAVLAKPSDLVIVLAGDVDRAGHSRGGASALYREAAVTFDGALGRLVPKLDLTRHTLIVTADHGHV